MSSLKTLCTPRKEIFDARDNDDVQDITALRDGSINPSTFLNTNYRTQGMTLLLQTAFQRFKGNSRQNLIKLTQSMGGGKTHNMLTLGLLAQHPEFRQELIGKDYKDEDLGKVDVVTFSGRETEEVLWQSIARQLGKEEEFKEYYSPVPKAPGQSAWMNLLSGGPKLILFDELPPYLDYYKDNPQPNYNITTITTGLANLFNALNKSDLSNVLVVISDLSATYQRGSQLLQSTFKELEGEVNRFALDIEPVGSSSDEIYDILKKRLFERLPSGDEVNQIALDYRAELEKAKQMGYSNFSSDKIFTGIKDAYPFHPSLRELYERFKENQNFQQTRDLIRLMRYVVTNLWQSGSAERQQLINPYDLNLNDTTQHTFVTQIKQSLSNAISHDIANKGRAAAEIADKETGSDVVQDLAKLLLVASLADIPNALLGLSQSDIVGYLASPGRDLTRVKNSIEEFFERAWYLHTDKDGRFFFQKNRNLIAEKNSLMDSFTDDQAKLEIRDFLKTKFTPRLKDCYQSVLVFPPLDEIKLSEDEVTLILFEPHIGGGVHPKLKELWDNTQHKNRLMFLSGERDTMDDLIHVAKEYRALQKIIKRMKDERVREDDTQFIMACDLSDKAILRFLSAARETFVKLYYPSSMRQQSLLMDADFIMDFSSNDYNGEDQIRKLLTEKQKFISGQELTGELFRQKCEDRLFTQKEMRWMDIKSRAAANPTWQWHHPQALDDLLQDCKEKKLWREAGGYIEKPPFPKEKTTVTVKVLSREKRTGSVVLQIDPKYGDTVYWEIGQPPTTGSSKGENFNHFPTGEMKLYFLCTHSKGEHETGDPVPWQNELWIGYEDPYDAGDYQMMQLQASHDAKILYTTDGSSPRNHGAVYEGDFVIPEGTAFVVAIAEKDGIWSEELQIPIPKKGGGIAIRKSEPLQFTKSGRFRTSDSNETFSEFDKLKNHSATVRGVTINMNGVQNGTERWAMLNFDEKMELSIEQLENQINLTRENIFSGQEFSVNVQIETLCFDSGQRFEDWVAEKKGKLSDVKSTEIRQ